MENNQEEFDKAYKKAINLIKIRAHGSGELIRKLTTRHFNAEVSRKVTEKLIEQGLIDNSAFLEGFVDSLIRFKTIGFYGILAKLRSRSVEKDEAMEILAQKYPIETEKEIALKVLEKEKDLDKIKLAQKLSRKGFRSEVISQVINSSS